MYTYVCWVQVSVWVCGTMGMGKVECCCWCCCLNIQISHIPASRIWASRLHQLPGSLMLMIAFLSFKSSWRISYGPKKVGARARTREHLHNCKWFNILIELVPGHPRRCFIIMPCDLWLFMKLYFSMDRVQHFLHFSICDTMNRFHTTFSFNLLRIISALCLKLTPPRPSSHKSKQVLPDVSLIVCSIQLMKFSCLFVLMLEKHN